MDEKKVCQVCGDRAKPKEIYFSHYGAICCLGCKAFFRRIFREGSRNPDKLICKHKGRCDLKHAKHRKCRKCRYDKCISIGMSPNMVPDEEESKKYTYPNKKKKTPSSITAMSLACLNTFTECSLELEIRADKIDVFTIANGHRSSTWTIDATLAVFSWLKNISDMFGSFAYKSNYFASLTSNDQFLLLKTNTRLFHNYILGRYLGAENASDQLSWLMLPTPQFIDTVDAMHSISFEQFNLNGQILPLNCTELQADFGRLLKELSDELACSQFHNGIIAHCLLFHTSHWCHHELGQILEPARIASIEDLSKEALNHSLKDIDDTMADFDVPRLVRLLEKMAVTKSQADKSGVFIIENMNTARDMRQDELDWIAHQSSLFDQAKMHIPVTDEFAQTYLMFVQGKRHLRGANFKMGSHIVSKRILFMCEAAGLKLSQSDIVRILETNMPLFYLVLVLKNLSLQTSLEQVEFYFGNGGALAQYKNELTNLPQLTMETLHGIDPYYKKHEWGLQKQLSKKLNDFLCTKEVLGLVLLIIMLDNIDTANLQMFRNFTLKMLLKSLNSTQSCRVSSPGERLRDFWEDLRNYSNLLRKLLVEVNYNS